MKIENRIYISKGTNEKLKVMKARTGLTPNVLCRFALMAQAMEPPLNENAPQQEVGNEFNRSTLLGDYETYFGYLTQLQTAPLGALIDRGMEILYPRVKNLEDLVGIAVKGHG